MIDIRPDSENLTSESRAIWLRRDAEKIVGALPPLLADAQQLAYVVAAGLHGRRQPGRGDDFWQFRQAIPGDPATLVDWRRSGRSDLLFVREREREAAQNVHIWADASRAMEYRGPKSPYSKGERARLLALALAILLKNAGERVALMGTRADQPKSSENHLELMALEMSQTDRQAADFGVPPSDVMVKNSKAVLLSDFLGPTENLMPILNQAADQGVSGCLVQILDEVEETFPFDGRVRFESMAGTLNFETQKAAALRKEYIDKLAERRLFLETITRRAGWRCLFHRTNESPRKALLWLYMAIGEVA